MSRQLLQLLEPPFGFTSRLRRETRLQRWIHRNALASLCLCRSLFRNLCVSVCSKDFSPNLRAKAFSTRRYANTTNS
ncbi:MAG: hypothetical protein ACYTX0_44135, partial [Nostoc sp.]